MGDFCLDFCQLWQVGIRARIIIADISYRIPCSGAAKRIELAEKQTGFGSVYFNPGETSSKAGGLDDYAFVLFNTRICDSERIDQSSSSRKSRTVDFNAYLHFEVRQLI